MSVNIIKGGLRTCVDEQQFKTIYEPAGWRIDSVETPVDEHNEVIKTLKTESEIKNYKKTTATKPKQFKNKLLKSEE